MPGLIWLPEALRDIERLHYFLSAKSPRAARNAVSCVQAAARQLEDFPEIGRPMGDRSGVKSREIEDSFFE